MRRALALCLSVLALPALGHAQRAPSPSEPPQIDGQVNGSTESESDEPVDLAERRLGSLVLTSGENQLQIGMGVQVRSTTEWDDGASTVFHLRRARPVLRASFLDGRVRFKLFFDLAPRALELIDLNADVRLVGSHSLRLGIAKIPFTSHWDQSYLSIPFVDWPLTTRWFGGGRQLGVTAMNDSSAPVSYAIGVYSGQTLRSANGGRFTTAYGGARTNYLSLQKYTPLDTPHPEIAGRLMLRSSSSILALSAAWDTRPTFAVDESLRIALDGSTSRGPFALWGGLYFAASEDRDGRWMGALGGALLEGRVRLAGAVDLAARYSAVFRSAALRRDSRTFADEAIAAAVENQDTLLAQYEHVGHVRAEHELTLAVSAYIFGNDLKWVTDASWLHTAGLDQDSFRLRSQVQLAF